MTSSNSRRQMLDNLLQLTRSHVYADAPEPLGTLAVFHCLRPQSLHAVPIHQPSVIVVLNGEKRLRNQSVDIRSGAGEIILLPAMSEFEMENLPASGSDYVAICLSFAPATVTRFINGVGQGLEWREQLPTLTAPVPEDILLSLIQRFQWSRPVAADAPVVELRQQELLAMCGQHGLLGNLLLQKHPSLTQRVAALLALDCARDWKIGDLCRELALSESSLRRELARENTGFRELLEQTRLAAGLCLLQETRWNVAEVAAAVGYQSPSRFAARFRERFGLSPAQLKQSREHLVESGAILADSGAPAAVDRRNLRLSTP